MKTVCWPWSEALTRHLDRGQIDDPRAEGLDLIKLAELYNLVSGHDALLEPGVWRPPEASFNPRPARVCQILLQARSPLRLQLLGAAFLHCCPIAVVRKWFEQVWSAPEPVVSAVSSERRDSQDLNQGDVLEFFRYALVIAVYADWIINESEHRSDVALFLRPFSQPAAGVLHEFLKQTGEDLLADSLQVALARHLDTIRHLHLTPPVSGQLVGTGAASLSEDSEMLVSLDTALAIEQGWDLIRSHRDTRRDSSRSSRPLGQGEMGNESSRDNHVINRLADLLESALVRYSRRVSSRVEMS